MEHWGRTLITSGKLAKRDMLYEELASSPDSEMVNYSRWLMAQKDRSNMSPPIKDMIAYLPSWQGPHPIDFLTARCRAGSRSEL